MMKKLLVVLIFEFFACSSLRAMENSISVMSFNVENLFDTQRDKIKNDVTYLPLSQKKTREVQVRCKSIQRRKWRQQCLTLDWNENALKSKLSRIAQVIQSVDSGRGPDLVVLQEVENLRILERLRMKFLRKSQYQKAVLLESSDYRGIDVGILSRLKLVGKPVLFPIAFKSKLAIRQDFREILRADFRLPDGKFLTVLGVHFPAPFHPRKLRETALRKLNEIAFRLPVDRAVIAAGDFNITRAEERKYRPLKRIAKNRWEISHFVGCKKCKGTNYYLPKKSWSFLDMILFSNSRSGSVKRTGWQLDPESIQIIKSKRLQRTKKETPQSFQKWRGRYIGVSDHFPILARITSTHRHD